MPRFAMLRDQRAGTFTTQIRPQPFARHREAAPESNQEKDVHDRPEQPREKTGELFVTELSDRTMVPDRRHTSAIMITKWRALFVMQVRENVLRDAFALLHRRGPQSGDGFAIGIDQ